MNPATTKEVVELARASDVEGLVICPPFPFLEAVGKTTKRAALGAQDVFWENPKGGGPYTGEVSAAELKNLGVKYVIVGHSERRANLGETDEMVANKVRAALDAGLAPILCVGESKKAREGSERHAVLKRQLEVGLSKMRTCQDKFLVAYEPLWAISTSKEHIPDTPVDTVQTINFLEKVFAAFCPDAKPVFIYGGSVNPGNAEGFLREKKIQGALVGGASLRADEIKKIVETARKYS